MEADLAQPLEHVAVTSDAVLALDVIEHLDDDRAVVARLATLVRPGGAVIVSVPALPALFTEFDAIQGHRRRHLPETLSEVFADSGLLLEQILWWGRWLVPTLRRHRAQPHSRQPDTVGDYRQYLELPPWPFPLVAKLAFLLEHGPASVGCYELVHHYSRWPVAPPQRRSLPLTWPHSRRDPATNQCDALTERSKWLPISRVLEYVVRERSLIRPM